MIELRKDYILDRWSLIALGRGKRPQETEMGTGKAEAGTCYFCPGNENLTPEEIGRVGEGGGWNKRWFPNKFPAVEPTLKRELVQEGEFLLKGEGFGYHEVVAETPEHGKQLYDLEEGELCEILKIYRARIIDLGGREGIKYVQVFKNSGAPAGTSITHSHSQIVALPMVPHDVREKIETAKRYDDCPYCRIAAEEQRSERHITSNESFTAFAAYAPRFNYEVKILPKKHIRGLEELDDEGIRELAQVFRSILKRLAGVKAPYNFYLHYAPAGEDLHFQLEIVPRLNNWAGFELAAGAYVITVSPEEAAAFFRE